MIKHFRVDKMLDIEITDQSRSGKEHFEKFDLANYAMIDRFGRDVMVHSVDEEHFSVSAAVICKPTVLRLACGAWEGRCDRGAGGCDRGVRGMDESGDEGV